MKPALALPLQQHPTFAAALRLLGRDVQRVTVEGAAPLHVIRRLGISFAPRGPVWDAGISAGVQCAQMRRIRVRLINAECAMSDALLQSGYLQLMTPAHVAELCIKGTDTDRLARARGKWRNIWRRAQNMALDIRAEQFDPNQHAWLFAADLAQQQQKRFRALPHAVVAAYHATSPKDVVVFVAYSGATPVAAMLFMLHQPVATYQIGWTSIDGRQRAAHHAILMHAAAQLSGQGITRLDLGTVDTERAPGLARFKIGSGAQVRALGGTWLKMPVSKNRFAGAG